MYRIYKGFTLVELVFTVFLISILLGAIWMVYNAGFKTFYSQWARSGVKGETGRALITLSRELRVSTSVTSAQQSDLSFSADTDNNGVEETIQYVWSGAAGQPLQRVSNVTIPAVNAVNNLAFSYYDANNNLLSFPVGLSQVRLVAVNITAADGDERFQLRTKIDLRNI